STQSDLAYNRGGGDKMDNVNHQLSVGYESIYYRIRLSPERPPLIVAKNVKKFSPFPRTPVYL
ncbi:hypothetical protein, partial [Escherichia coli]|uniref:hypothetical protein n=1 Tax=Escherichia coli TaxID=562 RepID=UPI003D17458C